MKYYIGQENATGLEFATKEEFFARLEELAGEAKLNNAEYFSVTVENQESSETVSAEHGAVCEFCDGNMLVVDGCKSFPIHRYGKRYERIKVGGEGDFFEESDTDARCGDCGAKYGHYHHPGCDCERCPACGNQLISCDCAFEL